MKKPLKQTIERGGKTYTLAQPHSARLKAQEQIRESSAKPVSQSAPVQFSRQVQAGRVTILKPVYLRRKATGEELVEALRQEGALGIWADIEDADALAAELRSQAETRILD